MAKITMTYAVLPVVQRYVTRTVICSVSDLRPLSETGQCPSKELVSPTNKRGGRRIRSSVVDPLLIIGILLITAAPRGCFRKLLNAWRNYHPPPRPRLQHYVPHIMPPRLSTPVSTSSSSSDEPVYLDRPLSLPPLPFESEMPHFPK